MIDPTRAAAVALALLALPAALHAQEDPDEDVEVFDDDDIAQPDDDRDSVQPEPPPTPRVSFELLGSGRATRSAWTALDGHGAEAATQEALAVVKTSENPEEVVGAALYLSAQVSVPSLTQSAASARERLAASREAPPALRNALAEALGAVGSSADMGEVLKLTVGEDRELALSAAKGLCRNQASGGLSRLVSEAGRLRDQNGPDSAAFKTLCEAVSAVAADSGRAGVALIQGFEAQGAPGELLLALGSAQSPEAREALREIARSQAFSDDPAERVVGLKLIAASVDRESTLAIVESLSDPDSAVRVAAAQAASSLSVKAALPALVELLRDASSPEGVAAAHEALKAITGAALPADPSRWADWLEAKGYAPGPRAEDAAASTAPTVSSTSNGATPNVEEGPSSLAIGLGVFGALVGGFLLLRRLG